MDDVSDIAAFYDSDPQREHARLEAHQLEYDLMWRFLTHYLPTHGRILEIGAATGRYTLELAKRGYAVTAVDLSPGLIDLCRKNLADARDLSAVTENNFDAVLLMGPLYHLVVEADRKTALQQAYDRLKTGGLLFSALLSRLGIVGDLLRNNPGWIEDQAHVQSFVTRGKRPDDAPPGGFRGYSAHVSEIAPLHESLGFETLAIAGVESAVGAYDENYNKLEGEQRQRWLDLLYQISTEPSIIGASRHFLYIGRK